MGVPRGARGRFLSSAAPLTQRRSRARTIAHNRARRRRRRLEKVTRVDTPNLIAFAETPRLGRLSTSLNVKGICCAMMNIPPRNLLPRAASRLAPTTCSRRSGHQALRPLLLASSYRTACSKAIPQLHCAGRLLYRCSTLLVCEAAEMPKIIIFAAKPHPSLRACCGSVRAERALPAKKRIRLNRKTRAATCTSALTRLPLPLS